MQIVDYKDSAENAEEHPEDAKPTIAMQTHMCGPPQLVLDQDVALGRVGGDAGLLQEIAELFIADYPRCIHAILIAVEAGDAKQLENAAHALKGAVSNFGAEPARIAANTLEEIGRSGDLQRIHEATAELLHQFAVLHPLLAILAHSEPSKNA
ncbi:MAG TPA: Hpt domain-containing protein [Bryobacteraceae bacterium]|nr:Hpt domain-containing protein [Bryobacteraceae bacterium]